MLIEAKEPTIDSKKLKDKNINVKSTGGMELKTEARQASFFDNVVVTMGNLHMQCNQLDVEYTEIDKKLQPKTLKGSGKVFCEEKDKNIKAWCDSLIYDHSSETMIVSSEKLSKVIKDEQSFTAQAFKIFLKTGEMKVEGASVLDVSLD
jgi:lipopolysaccharide transport protein LptA